jgi:2-oxoglutarate dehydrogenase E2 component (dihydrolipoamide succinyltransferase)
MSEKIVVPVLGESITEATVAKWLKSKGDSVEVDEPIVELETDKVNLEVPSPSGGVLGEINFEAGSTVEVGATLGSIMGGQSVSKSEKIEKIKPTIQQTKDNIENVIKLDDERDTKLFDNIVESDTQKIQLNETKDQVSENNIEEDVLILTEEIKQEKKVSTGKEKVMSPAVRKIVSENNLNINDVKGSGKDGMVLKGDLLSLMGAKPAPSERKLKFGEEEKIKMSRLRMTIAKRLKQSQENAAMLTTFNEVDMTNIMDMRKNNQDDFQKKFKIKLGMMSFFVKACVVGLKLYPAINAEVEGESIIYKNYYNISFAVGTDKGLVVPVLKNADEMSFADIEMNIKALSDKAKDGKITIEDLQGGTFTISNGGVYGSMLSTPILNLPQSGVLGMHNIVSRPIVVNNEIKIRPIMYLALSYDHRIIDGKEAVSFLKTVKENLEDPRRLFLNL